MKRILMAGFPALLIGLLIAGAATACTSYDALMFRLRGGGSGWEMALLKGTGEGEYRLDDPVRLVTFDLGPGKEWGNTTAPFLLDYDSASGGLTVSFGSYAFTTDTGFAGYGFTSFGESARVKGPSSLLFSSVELNGQAIPGLDLRPAHGRARGFYSLSDLPAAGDLRLSGILSLMDAGAHGGARTQFQLLLGDAAPVSPQVPLPPSIVLLGSGAAGLLLAKRKFGLTG